MSDSPERADNDILFVTGKGNQSAICGSVEQKDKVQAKEEAEGDSGRLTLSIRER